ncbi:hypothetical protein PQ455_06555 [Sphingomonas naphthae]|uniref:Uncharacterized protein n=1 Tax=Sphingomonas naphthae TaxID=1813468 RepID=A0ABY7TQB6_9SPHN|nr:hypothetical protein [Sphingomonas naphthae]WCT74876.1 hypothetical protein PQ455_06555 [Sphingomonas naphthae]
MIRRALLAAALVAMPTVASAQALQNLKLGCIERQEAAALVTFALPSVVTKLAERCGPVLPRAAYLTSYAPQLADRYRPDAAAAWPTARKVIGRVFSQVLGQLMPPEMNSDALRFLVEPMLASLLAEKIKPNACFEANEVIESLSTVPGRDIGRLAALGVAIADRKGNGIAGVLKVCRPEERP